MKQPFKIGEKVRFKEDDFDAAISKGINPLITHEIVDCWYALGQWFVTISGGYWAFCSARFESAEEEQIALGKLPPVIRKIKEMAERRRNLGYKF